MKHIHFIGICGVAMSAIAIAFKKAGFEVSGSDVGFFPPVSTNLKKHNIKFYPGWHPERMGTPDLVIVGNVASSTNPEWLYVQEKKLNYKSYPETIEEYFVKENSIVCAGTYGKTTTSALLSFVLTECGYNPSYMFGGIAIDDDFPSAVIPAKAGIQKWSILEGDEYKSSRWDNGAKFFHYHPTHLLLTDIKWDHADVYSTEKNYFEAFEKLIESLPKNGMIVMNEKIKNIAPLNHCAIVTYGHDNVSMYQWDNVTMNKNGVSFKIVHNSKIYNLQSAMIGDYMAENICGVFAMAHQIGIEPDKIISAIAKFKGLKRRLEKRFEGTVTVFDDIAHSPAKAKSVLENLAKIYKCHCEERSDEAILGNGVRLPRPSLRSGLAMTEPQIICIFEPNTGNRQPQSAPSYDKAFVDADEVIIPKLTKLKTSDESHHFEGDELVEIIKKTQPNTKYIDDDNKLINYLTNNTKDGDVIVFCGSHGFRGMIDQLISRVSNKQSKHRA